MFEDILKTEKYECVFCGRRKSENDGVPCPCGGVEKYNKEREVRKC